MSLKKQPINVVQQDEQPLPAYSEMDPAGTSGDAQEQQEQELHYQPSEQLGPSYVPQARTELDEDFTTGLCECHKSIPICLIATYAPCYSWGSINVAVSSGNVEVGEHDEGNEAGWQETVKKSLPYAGLYLTQVGAAAAGLFLPTTCLGGLFMRSKLRKKYGMKPAHLKDAASHFCCHCLALAQDHREMVYRERARREGYVLAQQREAAGLV